MTLHLSKPETLLLATFALLFALAVGAPPLAQPPDQHAFADQRPLWGVPSAMDVLSNLPFAVLGLAGLASLARVPREALAGSERLTAALFFVGLVVTAAGSGWYHLQPGDTRLAGDRAAMVLAFAGVVGLAVATRVSGRAGVAAALATVAGGLAAVLAWVASSNVAPWAVVQFGGMLLVAAMAFLPRRPGALAVRWLVVLATYAAAKVLEMNDHALYELTGAAVSGHTAKHVLAALAAVPVIAAVAAARGAAQNAPAALARA